MSMSMYLCACAVDMMHFQCCNMTILNTNNKTVSMNGGSMKDSMYKYSLYFVLPSSGILSQLISKRLGLGFILVSTDNIVQTCVHCGIARS